MIEPNDRKNRDKWAQTKFPKDDTTIVGYGVSLSDIKRWINDLVLENQKLKEEADEWYFEYRTATDLYNDDGK